MKTLGKTIDTMIRLYADNKTDINLGNKRTPAYNSYQSCIEYLDQFERKMQNATKLTSEEQLAKDYNRLIRGSTVVGRTSKKY